MLALALGILGVPQARWAQRRCRGAQPAGAAFAAQPCEVGKGGLKSLTHQKAGNRCIGRFLCAEVRGGGGVLPAQRARQNPIVGAPRAAGALAKPQNLNAIFEAFSGLFPHRCQKRRNAACAPFS